MIRRSWRTQLKASTSPQAVLSLVSRFLDEWSPHEIAALPPRAWPTLLVTKADLLAHALELGRIHSEFTGPPSGLAGLQELLLFFTHAGVRMTQLESLQRADQGAGPTTASPPAGSKPVLGEDA